MGRHGFPTQDDGSGPDPGSVADGDRERIHGVLVPFFRVDGMDGRAKGDANAEQAAFPDGHFVIIDQGQTGMNASALSDGHGRADRQRQRLINPHIFAHEAEHPLHQSPTLFHFAGLGHIEFIHQILDLGLMRQVFFRILLQITFSDAFLTFLFRHADDLPE